MLKVMNKKEITLLLGILTIATGCGQTATESTESNIVLDAAKQVTPVIGKSAALSFANTESTSSLPAGSVLYALNAALEEYSFPEDEGEIDMHNIYKVLTHTGQVYDHAEENCADITEAPVSSPFDLAMGAPLYNCGGNTGTEEDAYSKGFAINKSAGTLRSGLLTFRSAPNPEDQIGTGVLQFSYDEATGELDLRMVSLTHYPNEEGFVVRTHIRGNDKTNEFTLSSISMNTGASGIWTSFIGKGVSQGEGNHFLFKVKNSSGVDGNYVCFPANAKLDDLVAAHEANPEGKTEVDEDCQEYQSAVDAETFLTSSDVPLSANDYEGASIELTF